MGGFGNDAGGGDAYQGETETKTAKATQIKSSPIRGKKRVVFVEKTGTRKVFTADMSFSDAKDVKRKSMYNVEVYEKEDEARAGSMQKRESSTRTKFYMCDEAPELYTGGHKPQFKSFGRKGKGGSSGHKQF